LASISSTFYASSFLNGSALHEAFLYLQFGFVIFWQKNITAKAARKMLMKLLYSQGNGIETQV